MSDTTATLKKQKPLHPISEWIRNRKTIYAYSYTDENIPKDTIEEIITNGLWAPTHKNTQPWRFEVLEGKHKADLGEYLLNFYKEKLTLAQFPESRYQETLNYPKNATLIVIVFQRSKRIQIPEWEEIAAISSAVQNMWLSCSAMGIGSYWDSAEGTIAYCKENITLKENEKCLGIFYMGMIKDDETNTKRKRRPLIKKLKWNIKK